MLKFTKMHGIGNDYVYIDCFKYEVKDPEKLAIKISDRHKGVGGDGLVLICPSETCDAKMRMFNADGSEGKMCGNAIRCVAKYIVDEGYTKKGQLKIETLSGVKTIVYEKEKGLVKSVKVNMGKGSADPKSLPITSLSPIIYQKYTVGGRAYDITCVSTGNPHCVVIVNDPDAIDIEKIGPMFEHDKLFPERVNTEFITILSPSVIKMRVWERGSGETMACGTGACASVYACVLCGALERNRDITVKLKGGDLKITCTDDDTLFMTGEATRVFDGEYYEDQY